MVKSLRRESPVPVDVMEPPPCGVVMVAVVPPPPLRTESRAAAEVGPEVRREEDLSVAAADNSARSSLRLSRERRSRPMRERERISLRKRDSSLSADMRWRSEADGERRPSTPPGPVTEEMRSRDRDGVMLTRRRSGSELRDSLREEDAPAGGSRIPRAAKAEEVDGERPAARARASVESAPVRVEDVVEVRWVRYE